MDSEKLVPRSNLTAACLMAYASVTPLLAVLAAVVLFPRDIQTAAIAATAMQPLLLLAGSLLAFLRTGMGLPYSGRPASGIVLGVACAMLMWPGAAILSALFSAPSGEPPAMADTIRGLGLFPAVLLLALLPAVCEEIYARGFLYGALSRYGAVSGITGSAICFALLHGSFGQAAYALYCGVMLGMARYASGSILPCIAGHFLFNLSSVASAFLPAAAGVDIPFGLLAVAAVPFTAAFSARCAAMGRHAAHAVPEKPDAGMFWLLAGAAASMAISHILR